MTIIEKIKAEIERLYGDNHNHADRWDMGYDAACEKMLDFLDTLESEKPLGEEYAIEIGKYTHTLRIGSQSDIDNLIRQEKQEQPEVELEERICSYDKNEAYNELLDFLTTLEPEKPMNLEEEISRYLREECSGDDEPSISEIARHFAQWGAEHLAGFGKTLEIKSGDEVTINGHKIIYDKDNGYVTIVKSEESVPNDLEEAADKYAEKHGFRVPYDGSDNFYDDVDVKASKEGFIAGAKWQADHAHLPEDTVLFNKGVEEGKRLMMEEAMEGEVMTNGFYPYEPRIVAPYPNCPYDFGDKVRVIVLPKEY